MNPEEINSYELEISKNHISNVSNNTLNISQNRVSALSISYISYFYHVFPLHVNTFQQLFLNKTRPQIEQLKTVITHFHILGVLLLLEIKSLYILMAYLGGMAYLILVHILYLLSSIYGFNSIQSSYIRVVQTNLILFKAKIKVMLLSSSIYIHALMNILISHFCEMIKSISDKIKTKLIFYLKLVIFQIYIEYMNLYLDVKSINKLVSDLESEVTKYIKKLEKVNKLSKKLKKSVVYMVENHISVLSALNKIMSKLLCKLKYICSSCKDLNSITCCMQTESFETHNECKEEDIIVKIKGLSSYQTSVSIMRIDPSQITTFQNALNSIITILENMVTDNKAVSDEIKTIREQLSIVEEINLVKLFLLINQIQAKYLKILTTGYLLLSTIEFYKEIKTTLSGLIGSLEFECSNVNQFLTSCCNVEEKAQIISQKIDDCITKLAKVCNSKQHCSAPKHLVDLYVTLIKVILYLKFYVDLMIREMLIFKMIIHNLIVMAVSSSLMDALNSQINSITSVGNAIAALIVVDLYLKAFYFIQLENTMIIFGLSSNLLFSEFIQEEYYVLLLNLYWISRLIFVIECYINHLIAFKYVTTSLNNIFGKIVDQLIIITYISNVISSMATIIDELWSITNSMSNLNEIQENLSIQNWKQSGQDIRNEINKVNGNIRDINSQVKIITQNYDQLVKSWASFLSLYYYLLILLSRLYSYIQYTNKHKLLGTGIGNDYYYGIIYSVMEPCNKILMFIFGYIFVIWLSIADIIIKVENIMNIIFLKVEFLQLLHYSIEDNINEIDKKVFEVECAIEAVVRNTIRCSLKSLLNDFKKSAEVDRGGVKDNPIVNNYSLLNITNYNVVIDRLYEIWSFSDEATKLFNFIWFCKCDQHFRSNNPFQRPSTFPYSLYLVRTRDVNPVSELARNTMADNVGNHLCLCLVIKYHLRPAMLKCILYLRNEDLGSLSSLSRKHDKYNKMVRVNLDLWKIYFLVLSSIYKIVYWIKHKHNFVWVGYYSQPEIKCFCTIKNTLDYHYLISIILYLSSLIENIWNEDNITVKIALHSLSSLLSEYQSIHVYTNYYSESRCRIYPFVVETKCNSKEKKEGGKCCWCVVCYSIMLGYIYLCLECKLCKAICKNKELCKEIDKYLKILKCDCECLNKEGKEICCLLKLAISSRMTDYSGRNGCVELEKLVKDCCPSCRAREGCCKKIMDKIKSGNTKLLLIGCCCTYDPENSGCNARCGSSDTYQAFCLLFDSPPRTNSVAVVIVCKCKDPATCCCLTKVIDKLKGKLKKLCEEECKCEELTKLEEICNTSGCGAECPCATLKEKLKQICGNNNDCLCKKIKELGTLCASKQCPCKAEKCCRCVCCKLLISGVRILVRACKLNVLEPYKRIVIELLSGSKDNQIKRMILDSINDVRQKQTFLVKNNYRTHFNTYTDHKNIANSFRSLTVGYGYESVYEH